MRTVPILCLNLGNLATWNPDPDDYRNLIVRTAAQMKNKMSGLLMEVGASYDKRRLHGRKYFGDLLERVEDVPESVKELLRLSRNNLELFTAIQKKLTQSLREQPLIRARVERLMSIAGVGEIMALTWVLEMGDPARFSSSRDAISYCGLCSAQRESAGKGTARADLQEAQQALTN